MQLDFFAIAEGNFYVNLTLMVVALIPHGSISEATVDCGTIDVPDECAGLVNTCLKSLEVASFRFGRPATLSCFQALESLTVRHTYDENWEPVLSL